MKTIFPYILAFITTLLIYSVVIKQPEMEWLILVAIALCVYSFQQFGDKEISIKKHKLQSVVCKPNRRRYLSFLLLAISITLEGASIHPESPWFTIIIGIGTGGVASVAVAWLIEEANCKEKEQRGNTIYGLLLGAMALFAYSHVCMYQALQEEQEGNSEKHTWVEWKDLLITRLDEASESDIPEKLKYIFDISYRETAEELQFVLSQQLQLIADGLMTSKIASSLRDIHQKLELCETVMEHGNCKEMAFHLSRLAMSLEAFFDENNSLRHYNTIIYSDLVEFDEEARKHEAEEAIQI